VLATLPSWQGALADASIPVQRGVLRPLIERITPVRIARGEYRVDITWTAIGAAIGEISEAAAMALA